MLDAQRSSGVHHIITLLLCCCVDASMHQCVGASVCCCGLVRNGRRKSKNGRAGSIVNISNCSSLVFIMSWGRRCVSVSACQRFGSSVRRAVVASMRQCVGASVCRRVVVTLLCCCRVVASMMRGRIVVASLLRCCVVAALHPCTLSQH